MKWLWVWVVIVVLLGGWFNVSSHSEPLSSQEPERPIRTIYIYSPHVQKEVNTVKPEHLKLPTIKAPVVPLTLSRDNSELTPPDDPKVLGWWGAKAGARHGVTLLVGHTVHTGGGTLDHLEDVPVGAAATVSGVRYTVTSNRVMLKTALARRAPRLFSQTGPPRLVVVTCEGYDWNTGIYSSNVVLVAKPTRSSK